MAQLADRVAGVGIPGWFLLLLSVFIGSFLGTVIRRLPEGRPIMMSARSACEACGARLAPRDLVPLVSWLAARGRCRYCGVALGWFYPGVELGALAVATIAITIDGPEQAWLDCLLGWWLLALGWIDLRVWLLPDALTLPLLAAIGYLALRAIGWIYERLRGREGLGQGDAKLFAAAGAWLGTAALSQVVLLAAAAALLAAAAVGLSGTRIRAHTALPFGPFLALAIWPLWLFGPIHL